MSAIHALIRRPSRILPHTRAWLAIGGLFLGSAGFSVSPAAGVGALVGVIIMAVPIHRQERRLVMAELERMEREGRP